MAEMIERVARAIDGVRLFSRFNYWASDRVEGCPIEICRYGAEDEEEIVVVARFGGDITESEALQDTVSKARAQAAIEAMREPTDAMADAFKHFAMPDGYFAEGYDAMIDAALSPTPL